MNQTIKIRLQSYRRCLSCWKKNAIVSQPKRKLKSRELLGQVISVREMDISFKIAVK